MEFAYHKKKKHRDTHQQLAPRTMNTNQQVANRLRQKLTCVLVSVDLFLAVTKKIKVPSKVVG